MATCRFVQIGLENVLGIDLTSFDECFEDLVDKGFVSCMLCTGEQKIAHQP